MRKLGLPMVNPKRASVHYFCFLPLFLYLFFFYTDRVTIFLTRLQITFIRSSVFSSLNFNEISFFVFKTIRSQDLSWKFRVLDSTFLWANPQLFGTFRQYTVSTQCNEISIRIDNKSTFVLWITVGRFLKVRDWIPWPGLGWTTWVTTMAT